MLKNDSGIPRDYCEVTLCLAREREGDKETPSARLDFSQTGACSTLCEGIGDLDDGGTWNRAWYSFFFRFGFATTVTLSSSPYIIDLEVINIPSMLKCDLNIFAM